MQKQNINRKCQWVNQLLILNIAVFYDIRAHKTAYNEGYNKLYCNVMFYIIFEI